MSTIVHLPGHQLFGSFSFTHAEPRNGFLKEVSTEALSSHGIELEVHDLQGMGNSI